MNNPLAGRLREAASGFLPGGAFLRRDRDGALYVTDAPRREPGVDWAVRGAAAGFECREEAGLLHLTPGPRWLAELEARFPEPPDRFSASLVRFAGRAPDADALALFARGARILDGERDDGSFERRLRQYAAEALRRAPNEPNAGSGLYACALVRYWIEEERRHEAEMAGTFLF